MRQLNTLVIHVPCVAPREKYSISEVLGATPKMSNNDFKSSDTEIIYPHAIKKRRKKISLE